MNYLDCSACGLCVAGCQAHQRTGREELTAQGRNLALQEGVSRTALEENVGACSLSGYCTAICPRGVDNEAVWFALRRQAAPPGVLEKLERHHREGSVWGILGSVEVRAGSLLHLGCALRGPKRNLISILVKALDTAGMSVGFPADEPCCGEEIRELGFDVVATRSRPSYVLEASCARAFPSVPSLWDALLARPAHFKVAEGSLLHVSARWLNASARSRWPLLESFSRVTGMGLSNVDAFHLASGGVPRAGDIVMETLQVSPDNPWLMEFMA